MEKNEKIIAKDLQMDYDLQNDSLFVYSRNKDNLYKESLEIGDNFILDLNENSEPIAFEILNISEILDVNKFSIQHLKKIEGSVRINKESICVKLSLLVPIHQKKTEMPFSMLAPNDMNLPNTLTHLGATA